MPLLRRPDDHRRDLRRRAPCAIAIAEPDQDRHLMTVVTHSASQRRSLSPPAARRSTTALTSPRPTVRSRRRADAKPAHAHNRTRSSSAVPADKTARHWPPRQPPRSLRDPQIPIGRAPPHSALPPRGFLLGRLSNAGPATTHDRPARGRRPKPFTKPEIQIETLPKEGRLFSPRSGKRATTPLIGSFGASSLQSGRGGKRLWPAPLAPGSPNSPRRGSGFHR